MGRHSVAAPAKTPSRRFILSIIAGVAVVGVVASGVYLWVGGHLNPLFASAGEPACEEIEQLQIVADPSIAAPIEELAADFDADPKRCVETKVRAQDSADTAAELAAGTLSADAWVPDSSVWLARTASTAASLGLNEPDAAAGASIASSPVVFAAPASEAQELAAEPVSWARVLNGTLPALLPDPEASAASLASLYALQGQSSPDDPRQFAGALIALGKSIPATADAAMATVASAGTPTVVLTSEASVAAHNADASAEPLVAAYPEEGTVALDYPFVRIGDAGSKNLDKLETALGTASDLFLEAGFRGPDGSGEVESPGITPTAPPAQTELDGAAQVEILRSWSVLTLRSRMLAVIDVSGSMEEPADNGLRRIDIFQQAAVGAMSKFSGEVELGVWIFSTARNGDLDYEDLSPIAPLADTGHTQQIQQIIGSLPSRLGGATGLYDTTLAAFKKVQESYDPDKVNSVLVITDGKNEDENGISLDQLLGELKKLEDPTKPVAIIMIGFGPDTDFDAMKKIAAATKGGAYSATKPEDLGTVLVDALSQRGCRPDCG
ncbi:substrate-binding and VWA domain-containing protein [Agromyces tropicus]|uniref:Substrate-binding and VWA domain-containing protein n=1 Tax=Agromyces tropicus TaxID=555371 RepID=A0ABN2U470_9MICO